VLAVRLARRHRSLRRSKKKLAEQLKVVPAQKPAPASTAPPAKFVPPVPAPQPGPPLSPAEQLARNPAPAASTIGERTFMSASAQRAAEAIREHLSGLDPENMSELDRTFHDLPQVFAVQQEVFSRLAEALRGQHPVESQTCEAVRELAGSMGGVADFAQEIYHTWRSEHAEKLKRIEQPGPAEHEWDVRANT
jgi:hypothetical protein